MGRGAHNQLLIPRSAEVEGTKRSLISGWRVLIPMHTSTRCLVWGIQLHPLWLFLTYGLP